MNEQTILHETKALLGGIDFEQTTTQQSPCATPYTIQAIHSYLQRLCRLITDCPQLPAQAENPQGFAKLLNFALEHWNLPTRLQALTQLADIENQKNELEKTSHYPDGYEAVELKYHSLPDGQTQVTLSYQHKRGFFKTLYNAVISNGAEQQNQLIWLQRHNPISTSIRLNLLLAFTVNHRQLSTLLKWGYLSENEAGQCGLDLQQWQAARAELKRIEHLFIFELNGHSENLKTAITKNYAGTLSGENTKLLELENGQDCDVSENCTGPAREILNNICKATQTINYKKLVEHANTQTIAKLKKRAESLVFSHVWDSGIPGLTHFTKYVSTEEDFLIKALAAPQNKDRTEEPEKTPGSKAAALLQQADEKQHFHEKKSGHSAATKTVIAATKKTEALPVRAVLTDTKTIKRKKALTSKTDRQAKILLAQGFQSAGLRLLLINHFIYKRNRQKQQKLLNLFLDLYPHLITLSRNNTPDNSNKSTCHLSHCGFGRAGPPSFGCN